MKVLVTGLNVFDSGKTWVSIALYRALLSGGLKPAIYKPVASFNIWYSYGTFDESVKRRQLLSNDALAYERHLNVTELTYVNPISIALAPLNPESYRRSSSLERYHADIQDLFSQIIMARVTNCDEKTSTHYIFKENLINLSKPISEKITRLSEVLSASSMSVEGFKAFLVSTASEETLVKCSEKVERDSDVLIIESFNDSIAPYGRALMDSEYILTVAPSMIYLYKNDEKLLRVIEEGLNAFGVEALRSYYVAQRVEPLLRVETDLVASPTELSRQIAGILPHLSGADQRL